MKIIHLCQYWNKEYSYQDNILPEYQKKEGHEVVVLTSEYANFHPSENTGKYKERNYEYVRLKTIFNFKNRFVKFKNLEKVLEEEKPDYIFFHGTYSPDLKKIIDYKIKNKCILVIDNHADLDNSGKNILWRKFYYEFIQRKFHKKYSKYIDKYFGVTPRRCEFLKDFLRIPVEKIDLLPVGAEIQNEKKFISKKEFKVKYNTNSKKIISFGGKITENKFFFNVINAFLEINNSDTELFIFGKIIDKNISQIIEGKENIKYLGWKNREETLEILKNSYLTVWPRHHTTLIEDSIAMEVPTIMYKNENTSHLVGEFLLDSSVAEIKEKLQKLIDDDKYYQELKKQTYKFSKILSYEEIAKISLLINEKDVFKNKRRDLFN